MTVQFPREDLARVDQVPTKTNPLSIDEFKTQSIALLGVQRFPGRTVQISNRSYTNQQKKKQHKKLSFQRNFL